MARRFVQVEVVAHQEVEGVEGAGQPLAVGCGEDGVSHVHVESTNSLSAVPLDFLGEGSGWNLAADFGQTAHAGMPATVGCRCVRFCGWIRKRRGRVREHCAAFAVEVAAHDVQDVDGPTGEGSEALGTGPQSAVTSGRRGRCKLPREGSDRVRFDPRESRDAFRRKRGGKFLDFVESPRLRGEAPGRSEPLIEQDVHDREQECRVRTGSNEVVFVRQFGRLAAARIDDDDFSAAIANRSQARAKIGRRQQASIRYRRVRAQHEQVVGAIDVGYRDDVIPTKHLLAREILWNLVTARGGESPLRPHGAREYGEIEQRAKIVGGRVADVRRQGIRAMRVSDGRETLGGLCERDVPVDFAVLAVHANQRFVQAVRIFVQALQSVRFGAQISSTMWIEFIAADRNDRVVGVRLDRDSTMGLAERTGSMGRLHGFELRGVG